MSVRAFCIPLKEAAKRIGVSRITMRKYCRDGSIDARKTPGGHWRVSSLSLELFQPGKKRIDEICRMFEHESAIRGNPQALPATACGDANPFGMSYDDW